MLRQRSEVSKYGRQWDFLHAVFECQIGSVKIDFTKLALKLGYKNERCAQDMYHRFRRAHFPEHNRLNRNKPAPARNHKQQFRPNGQVIQKKGTAPYHDDEARRRLYDDDDDDDDENDEEEGVSVKVEDAEVERAQNQFWRLGIIDLEKEARIKTEPGIKTEPVAEEWIWT